MAAKESRFVIRHAAKGLYLGNGWWSSGPEAALVNTVPTFTKQEISDGTAVRGQGGPTGAFAQLIGHEHLDLKDNRMSVDKAVELELVPESWYQPGE